MSRSRCSTCVGSGTVMGGGMIMRDCLNCDGTGKIFYKEEFHDIMHKESDDYKNARDKIKSLREDMTDEEAEKLLDDELENQSNDKQIKRERKKVPAPLGRPTGYNLEMAEYVCSMIATNAKGLERLCAENEGMPGWNTIKVWLRTYPDFRSMYLKAKEIQAHVLMDRTIDVANRDEYEEGDTLLKINRDKLKIDTYKFASARLNPRDYGDKREVKTEVNLTETMQKIRDADSEYKY